MSTSNLMHQEASLQALRTINPTLTNPANIVTDEDRKQYKREAAALLIQNNTGCDRATAERITTALSKILNTFTVNEEAQRPYLKITLAGPANDNTNNIWISAGPRALAEELAISSENLSWSPFELNQAQSIIFESIKQGVCRMLTEQLEVSSEDCVAIGNYISLCERISAAVNLPLLKLKNRDYERVSKVCREICWKAMDCFFTTGQFPTNTVVRSLVQDTIGTANSRQVTFMENRVMLLLERFAKSLKA